LLKRVVDEVHHARGQPMRLQQMTKLQDRRLVGHRVIGQIQARKAAHRLDLVQGTASISARKRSRRVCFFFFSNACAAKAVCFISAADQFMITAFCHA